jgi:hypothetical protein
MRGKWKCVIYVIKWAYITMDANIGKMSGKWKWFINVGKLGGKWKWFINVGKLGGKWKWVVNGINWAENENGL